MMKNDRFYAKVLEEARAIGFEFYLKNGEGRELTTDLYEGEDLYGWLIPIDKSKMFKSLYALEKVNSGWDDYLVFAIWKIVNNKLKIEFKTF